MEPETTSPQPTSPAREGRRGAITLVVINLLVSVLALLCMLAWGSVHPNCNESPPWWLPFANTSALFLIPATIAFGIVALRVAKKRYTGLLSWLGVINILLGVFLLIPGLCGAVWSFYVACIN